MHQPSKSSSSWMLYQSHGALVTNVRVHSLFVGRLVLQAAVKAAVGMGDIMVHHYGPLHHPVSCKCIHTNPHFNYGSYHHHLQQIGCVLPWFTWPCVIAKHPCHTEFLGANYSVKRGKEEGYYCQQQPRQTHTEGHKCEDDDEVLAL